jgi:hypothetical protein
VPEGRLIGCSYEWNWVQFFLKIVKQVHVVSIHFYVWYAVIAREKGSRTSHKFVLLIRYGILN